MRVDVLNLNPCIENVPQLHSTRTLHKPCYKYIKIPSHAQFTKLWISLSQLLRDTTFWLRLLAYMKQWLMTWTAQDVACLVILFAFQSALLKLPRFHSHSAAFVDFAPSWFWIGKFHSNVPNLFYKSNHLTQTSQCCNRWTRHARNHFFYFLHQVRSLTSNG